MVTNRDTNSATGKRLKYLRENVLGLTQEQFASKFRGEFSRGAVGNWELGQGIKFQNLRRIAEKFGISVEWLATGDGETPMPDRQSYPTPKSNSKTVDRHQRVIDTGTGFGVYDGTALSGRSAFRPTLLGALPEIDVQLGAGEGTIGELYVMPGESVGHRVTAEWLLSNAFVKEEVRINPLQAVIMPVIGDSMFPSYVSGDRVIVDLSQREMLQDAVYAISDGNSAPQIKRLQRVFRSNPERVRIISDNPVYANDEQLLSEVQILGRICGVIARR